MDKLANAKNEKIYGCKHYNIQQYGDEKICFKGCFCVLWRNSCWAIIAPGHPPINPNINRVNSGTLCHDLHAANLSVP